MLPTTTFPKVRLVCERETGETAFPVRPIVWGLSGALSVIVIAPVRLPRTVGVNVILTEHFLPGATEPPQVLVCEKLPLATMLAITRGAVPVLVSVDVLGLLLVPMT